MKRKVVKFPFAIAFYNFRNNPMSSIIARAFWDNEECRDMAMGCWIPDTCADFTGGKLGVHKVA